MAYLEEDLWTYIFKPICLAPMQDNTHHYENLGCLTEIGGGIIYTLAIELGDGLSDDFEAIEKLSDSRNVIMKIKNLEDFDDMVYETDNGLRLMVNDNELSEILSAQYDEEDDSTMIFTIPESYIGDDVEFSIGLSYEDTLYSIAEKIVYVFKAIEYTVVNHLKNGDDKFTLSSIVEEIENNIRNKDIIYSNEEPDDEYKKVLYDIRDSYNPMERIGDIIRDALGANIDAINKITIEEAPIQSSEKSNKNTSTALLSKDDKDSKAADIVSSLMNTISSYMNRPDSSSNGLIYTIENTDIIVKSKKQENIKVPPTIASLIKKVMQSDDNITFALGKKINMGNNGEILDSFGVLVIAEDDMLYPLDNASSHHEDLTTIHNWYISELTKRGLSKDLIISAEKQVTDNSDKLTPGNKNSASSASKIFIDTKGDKSFIENYHNAVDEFSNGFIKRCVNINTPNYITSLKTLERTLHEAINDTMYDMYNKHSYKEDEMYEIDGYYDDLIVMIYNSDQEMYLFLLKDEQETDDQPPKYVYHLLMDHNLGPRIKHLLSNIKRAYGSKQFTAAFMSKYGFQLLDLSYVYSSKEVNENGNITITGIESFMLLKNALSFLDSALNLRIIEYGKTESKAAMTGIYNAEYQVTGKYNFSNVISQIDLMIKNKDVDVSVIDGLIQLFYFLSSEYYPYTNMTHSNANIVNSLMMEALIEEASYPTTYVYTYMDNFKIYYNCTTKRYLIDSEDKKLRTNRLVGDDILRLYTINAGIKNQSSTYNTRSLMVIEDFNINDHEKCKQLLSAFKYARTMIK